MLLYKAALVLTAFTQCLPQMLQLCNGTEWCSAVQSLHRHVVN